MIIQERKSIFLILITVSALVSSTNSCLVDKCAQCPSNTTVICTTCQSGWYLRTFNGGEKPYNECWSLTKLWLTVFSLALLSLALCGLCYYCYMMGKKWRINKMSKNQQYAMNNYPNSPPPTGPMMTEQPIQKSMMMQPPPVQMAPVAPMSPTYSPPPKPMVIQQPIITSPNRSPGPPRASVIAPPRGIRPSGNRIIGGQPAQRPGFISPSIRRSPSPVRRAPAGPQRRVIRR